MKKVTLIVTLCLAIFMSLSFVSVTYAGSPKAFEKMSQAEKDKKYKEILNKEKEYKRSVQSGKASRFSPQEIKEATDFLYKYASEKKNMAHSKRVERKRIQKLQSTNQTKNKKANTAYKKKEDIIIGKWKNSKGVVLSINNRWGLHLTDYKSMRWKREGAKIALYDKGPPGGPRRIPSRITVTYDSKADKITLKGSKYADTTYSRYKEKPLNELTLEDARLRQNQVIAKNTAEYYEKHKTKVETKFDETWVSSTGPSRESVKLAKEFETTLTCNNCDLTALKDYLFDCHWCEAEGSNFSKKKGKLWARFEFHWAKLKNSNFSETSIRNTSFYKADLRGADFSGARIGQSNFAYANLEGANFKNAQIGESLFNGANLKNADFTGATIVRTDFSFSNVNEQKLKSANLNDVKIVSTNLDRQLTGVWKTDINRGAKDVHYYEFFNDGSYISTKGRLARLTEMDPYNRAIKVQSYYSIRKGAFEKMAPAFWFKDSKERIKLQGDRFTFINESNSSSPIFVRARGSELAKYLKFRNTSFALISARYWNTTMIEKLSANGANYATLQSLYSRNVFDNMFLSYKAIRRVQGDRHTRHIFTTLLRENKEFRSGSGFENMLFKAMEHGFVETLKSLLEHSSSKTDMQYALIKYKGFLKSQSVVKSVMVDMVEKRIAAL